MKYLFVHRNFPGQFRYLAGALAADYRNEVVFLTHTGEGSVKRVKKVHYQPKAAGRTHAYLTGTDQAVQYGQAAYRAAWSLKQQGFVPDVIFGHSGWGPTLFMKDLFPQSRLLCYFEWFYRSSGSTHGFDPAVPVTEDNRAEIRTKNIPIMTDLVTADAGLTPTYWQRAQFPVEFHSKLHVLHDGVDTEYFQPNREAKLVLPRIGLDLSGAEEIVTYVATGMEPMRGFPQFMEAVALLQQRRSQCHVVVVGEDRTEYSTPLPSGQSYRHLMLEKYQYDLRRIHFTGRLSLEEYRQVLWASAAHVYLTYPFILSWSMLEAMACGCLIIGSKTPPVEEMIQDGVNGCLVDFFQSSELAEKLNEVLSDRSRWQVVQAMARDTIVQKYDLRTILPRQIQWLGGMGHA